MLFQEFKSQVQYPTGMQPQFGWLGFRRNEEKLFDSHLQAAQYSDIGVKRVFINELEYNDYCNQTKQCDNQAFELWYNWIRNKYSNLSDTQWRLCYYLAIRGEDDDYDQIAEKIDDIVHFAISFSAAK